jgi:hypothetical protein
MICVRFGLSPRKSVSLGPAPSYLISGDVLCIGPDWSIAAVYRDHAWEFRGSRFVRFQFTGQRLTLSDLDGAAHGPSGRFGPFDEVLMLDGTLFTDDQPFAKFVEETFAWYLRDIDTCLLNIIVEPEPAPTKA